MENLIPYVIGAVLYLFIQANRDVKVGGLVVRSTPRGLWLGLVIFLGIHAYYALALLW
jgi:hypothetical protein